MTVQRTLLSKAGYEWEQNRFNQLTLNKSCITRARELSGWSLPTTQTRRINGVGSSAPTSCEQKHAFCLHSSVKWVSSFKQIIKQRVLNLHYLCAASVSCSHLTRSVLWAVRVFVSWTNDWWPLWDGEQSGFSGRFSFFHQADLKAAFCWFTERMLSCPTWFELLFLIFHHFYSPFFVFGLFFALLFVDRWDIECLDFICKMKNFSF